MRDHKYRTLNRYDMDDTHSSFDAFPDDEAIFSAMDSNGHDLLIGDNNAFSGLGHRVVHLNANTGELLHSFSIEDPMDIEIETDWALIRLWISRCHLPL